MSLEWPRNLLELPKGAVPGALADGQLPDPPDHSRRRRRLSRLGKLLLVYSIAIHGGAGTLPRTEMTSDQEAAYRAGLTAALDTGYEVLDRGGTSLDAVTTAVRIFEHDPFFNAGRGAVLTHEGTVELDASIMDGERLAAGAIAGVSHVRNPIELARAMMEYSPHVMLTSRTTSLRAPLTAARRCRRPPTPWWWIVSRRWVAKATSSRSMPAVRS